MYDGFFIIIIIIVGSKFFSCHSKQTTALCPLENTEREHSASLLTRKPQSSTFLSSGSAALLQKMDEISDLGDLSPYESSRWEEVNSERCNENIIGENFILFSNKCLICQLCDRSGMKCVWTEKSFQIHRLKSRLVARNRRSNGEPNQSDRYLHVCGIRFCLHVNTVCREKTSALLCSRLPNSLKTWSPPTCDVTVCSFASRISLLEQKRKSLLPVTPPPTPTKTFFSPTLHHCVL